MYVGKAGYCRGEIADALKNMQKVYRPAGYLINRIFFDAKSDEIVNIFPGSTDEKSRIDSFIRMRPRQLREVWSDNAAEGVLIS